MTGARTVPDVCARRFATEAGRVEDGWSSAGYDIASGVDTPLSAAPRTAPIRPG